ncbi:nutrient deprivation-induced protein (plasmid) [Rhizobium sp. CB3090]|uniref:nutrient deprivation-induced protein n=1 Tax=Rhizobium sp. CB3090 TaxID=3039156 RepID=UPI0024B1ACC4|nr:nutrient deprivation-induced protein [Rhizobium sp. CB3090]WFU12321.1 nutrient deprivation-induced protein [Rhizobium sp. CB3090]
MNNQPDDPGPGGQTWQDGSDQPSVGAGTNEIPKTGSSGEAVRENLEELRQFAGEQTEQAKAALSDAAEDKKNLAARQLGGVASAFEKIGAELERTDQQFVGRYAKQIGRSLQGFSRDIEDRDLGEIAGMIEDFGRRQPLAFLGLAAIAGLTASRLLTASARRPSSQTGSRVSASSTPGGIESIGSGL